MLFYCYENHLKFIKNLCKRAVIPTPKYFFVNLSMGNRFRSFIKLERIEFVRAEKIIDGLYSNALSRS